MLQVESTGKTLDEAIANGLAELKVSKDNVDIKIIEKGAGSDFDPHLVELFLEDRDILSEMCVINREL